MVNGTQLRGSLVDQHSQCRRRHSRATASRWSLLTSAPHLEEHDMSSDYARSLGARLRAIRTQQGLSLHGVEERSEGRWKAVVVGSYERGDRAVTVQRLAELADFYGVPVSALLPEAGSGSVVEAPPRLIIDLERLSNVPAERAGPLARYAATIQSQRGDYNGRVLSIRQDDLRTLAVIYDMPPAMLAEELISWGVLDPDARRAVEMPTDR
jgi:transcriptional regulator with XRE-family HTH domain